MKTLGKLFLWLACKCNKIEIDAKIDRRPSVEPRELLEAYNVLVHVKEAYMLDRVSYFMKERKNESKYTEQLVYERECLEVLLTYIKARINDEVGDEVV